MRGRWRSRLVLALVGLLLPVLAVECGLRLAGPTLAHYSYVGLDTKRNLSHFEVHPILGGFHIPNTTTWQWTVEYVTRVDINSHGLREREIEYEKPPGLRRVLVLGDSFVEATEVAVEEAFPRRLEAHLQAAGGPADPGLNAGAVGYGTAQEYLLLKHEGVRYQPDWSSCCSSRATTWRTTAGRLTIRPSGRSSRTSSWTRAARCGRCRSRRRTAPRPRPARSASGCGASRCCSTSSIRTSLGKCPGSPRTFGRSWPPYESGTSPEVEEAWRVTEALLAATRDEAEGAGARFVLVNIPAPWEIDPPFWDRMRGFFGLPDQGWDLDRPNRRLGEIAARRGIAYLDLRSTLQAGLEDGQRLYFSIDGHWTSAGHDLAARTLARSGLVQIR